MSARHLLIDGMNVIGSRPDGWWRDRDAAVRRLVDRLKRLADAGESVTVVFDGKPLDDLPEGDHGGVSVLFARRSGPNAADDRIVELAHEHPEADRVVTSDRNLRDRLTDLGVEVEGALALLRRLESLDRADPEV
ncbi:NYN domain-containing protein [soil metagenome]